MLPQVIFGYYMVSDSDCPLESEGAVRTTSKVSSGPRDFCNNVATGYFWLLHVMSFCVVDRLLDEETAALRIAEQEEYALSRAQETEWNKQMQQRRRMRSCIRFYSNSFLHV